MISDIAFGEHLNLKNEILKIGIQQVLIKPRYVLRSLDSWNYNITSAFGILRKAINNHATITKYRKT